MAELSKQLELRTREVEERVKKGFHANAEHYKTVLVNVCPYFDEEGVIKEVTGCFTDISPLKHLEIMKKRRAEEAIEQPSLTEQLALRTQLAIASESKFKALAELTPAGLFYGSPTGEVLWANDTWFEITGHEKGLKESMPFLNIILDGEEIQANGLACTVRNVLYFARWPGDLGEHAVV
ncbi:hypothetical protein MMC18_003865 [Xylographa bjoerkii]|nr:hypothetical protein [Xylographa bjoerkii]